MKELTVLVIEPGKQPYPKIIPNTLEALQAEVGGLIQVIYPWEEPVAFICHDEGKLIGLPPNRVLRDLEGKEYDVIVGTFLVVGLGDEDFISLTRQQIDWISTYFGRAEMFWPFG